MRKHLALLFLVMIALLAACGRGTIVTEEETAENGLLIKTNEEREYWIECEKDEKNVSLDLDVKASLFLEHYDEVYNARNIEEIPAGAKSFFGFLEAMYDEGTDERNLGDEAWLAIDELNKGNVENYQEHIKNVRMAVDEETAFVETDEENNQLTPVEGILVLNKKINVNRMSLMVPSTFTAMDYESKKTYYTDNYLTVIEVINEKPEIFSIDVIDQIESDAYLDWNLIEEDDRELNGAEVHISTYETIDDNDLETCKKVACITNGSTYHFHVTILKGGVESPEEWVNEVFEEIYSTIEISE